MPSGTVNDAFRHLTAGVQSYVAHELSRAKSRWIDSGRRGDEPTQQTIEARFFAHSSAEVIQRGITGWSVLAQASVFPAIAHLCQEKILDSTKDLGHGVVNRLGVMTAKADHEGLPFPPEEVRRSKL